jgi:hypothetical protein
MQTSNDNRNSSKKTFVFGLFGGLAVAAALGAAFVIGGRAAGSSESGEDSRGLYQTNAAPDATQPAPQSQDDSQQPAGASEPQGPAALQPAGTNDQPAPDPVDPTETPVVEEPEDASEEEDEDDDGPTVTPEPPDGGCLYCGAGDLVIETPVGPDPCPECVLDLDIVFPLDVTPPTIGDIEHTFCYPVLILEVEVDAPAEVWFEFDYDGAHYESSHDDAANTAIIARDLGALDWSIYLVGNIEIHAVDLSGNHAIEYFAMPDPDLSC